MSKLQKLFFFSGLLFAAVILFSGKASAATFTSETHNPTTANYLSVHPACGVTIDPVDFTAYITNVNLDTVTGLVRYDIGIAWKSCTGADDTRAYAVFSPSQDICPLSGLYGPGPVYDCVKYVGSEPFSGPSNLSCPPLQGAFCMTPDFYNSNRIKYQNGPVYSGLADSLAAVQMSKAIPNWATLQNSSGSYQITGDLCQYYKTLGSNYTLSNSDRCLTLSLTVNWAVSTPNWDVEPGVSCDVNAGTITFTLDKTGTVPGTVTVTRSGSLSNPSSTLSIPSVTLNDSQIPWSETYTISPPPGIGQSVTANISVSPGGSIANDSRTCTSAVKSARPYVRAYGGDTIVGLPFKNGNQPCSKEPSASIETYTRLSGSDTVGAGSQFAVSAANKISGFTSASMHNGVAGASGVTRPANDLALSNAGGPGIGYDNLGYTGCLPDFITAYESQGNAPTPGIYDQSDLYYEDQNSGWGGVLFVDNLTISGDIVHTHTIFNSLDDVRNHKIRIFIVKGDINIRPNVERIDAILIAGGTVNTCDTSSGGFTVSDCKRQLTVNGAVMANNIKLNRLNGDVATAPSNEGYGSGNIAEVFNYPAVANLMLSDFGISDTIRNRDTYDSIVGLPPVL